MKNRFSKKVIVSIILIMVLGLISAGCAPAPSPYPTPTPQPCTMTVYSQNSWCYGYVWVNGASTGQWISFNGAVTITGLTAGTTAFVQIYDSSGFVSHQEILMLNPGNNIVTFTYW